MTEIKFTSKEHENFYEAIRLRYPEYYRDLPKDCETGGRKER